MIDVLIFSKDRACQLDLLLTSIEDNFKEINNVKIVCKGSDDNFIKGYMKLFEKYPEHSWFPETTLIEDIKNIVNHFEEEFAMTLVDDEIVIRDHSIKPLVDVLKSYENIHCASIRLGTNIGNYCYTADLYCDIPEFDVMRLGEDSVYKWDWTKGDGRVDWYYPSCINSHIYRTSFLKHWMNQIRRGNVNDTEGMLNSNRGEFKHHMICMKKSKTINIANNLTQTGYNRHSSKKEFSLKKLNKLFLDGDVIDKTKFYGIENDQATYEKDYVLTKGLE